MVYHTEWWLGTKMVNSALRMLALYMCFNGLAFGVVRPYMTDGGYLGFQA